jgi:hypothetical protein
MGSLAVRHDVVEEARDAAGEVRALREEIEEGLIVNEGRSVEDGEAEKIDNNPHTRHP